MNTGMKTSIQMRPGAQLQPARVGIPSELPGRSFLEMNENPKIQDREKYQNYLSSDEWRAKRNLVFMREDGICQGCSSEPIEHVHHTTYAHLYDELLFELVGLCENCHRKAHFFQPSFNPWPHTSR